MSWTVARWTSLEGLRHGFDGREDGAVDDVRTLRQVHGDVVLPVADLPAEERPEGDGLLARRGQAAVGVHTADCVPILLVAPAASVVGAVHSGWRGTVAGVFERALEVARRRFGAEPAGMQAALGPAIGGCCYEVGEEVRDAFRERYGADGAVGFRERNGSIRLDLREFLTSRLEAEGVSVERVGPCTACASDRLHSYRRQRGRGRQLSWIAWD